MNEKIHPFTFHKTRAAVHWLCVALAGAAWVCLPARGAELALEVDVVFSSAADAQPAAKAAAQKGTILVIDRSGSMESLFDRSTPQKGQRWEELKRNVRAQLNEIGAGEWLGVVIFQDRYPVRDEVKHHETVAGRLRDKAVRVEKKSDLDAVFAEIENNKPINNVTQTPLYEAIGEACEFAIELKKLGVEDIKIFVHSDGQEEVYRRVPKFKTFEAVRKSYPQLFVEQNYFRSLRLTGVWYDKDTPPPIDVAKEVNFDKAEVAVAAVCATTQFRHPANAESQTAALSLTVSAPQSVRDALDGQKCQVSLFFDGADNGVRDNLKTLALTPGRQSARLRIPDALAKGGQPLHGTLTVSGFPAGKTFKFVTPSVTIPLLFAPPDVVSLKIIEPADGQKFLKGDLVNFKAVATDGAAVVWDVGGLSVSGSQTAPLPLSNSVVFSAKAAKGGSLPAESERRKLEVIDAALSVTPPAGELLVGEDVSFTAVPRGPLEAVEWFVDGSPARWPFKFEKAGAHTIGARAAVRGLGRSVSATPLTVTVKPAPQIILDEPAADKFETNTPVALAARVEGGFAQIEWVAEGPSGTTSVVTVSGGAAVWRPSFAKGGEYTVYARGAVGGREKRSVNAVRFQVQRADLRLDIIEPADGQVTIDSEAGTALNFKARLVGDDFAKVRWTVRDAASGTVLDEAERGVDGVYATYVWTAKPELGNSAVVVSASAVFKPDSPHMTLTVTDEKPLSLSVRGGVEIASPVANQEIHFGGEAEFAAKISGAARKDTLKWSVKNARTGEWEPIANTGGKERHHKKFTRAEADGLEYADLKVEATLPDGSQVEDAVRVNLVSELVKAVLRIVPDQNRFDIGTVIKAEDASTGDIVSRAWFVNGEEKPEWAGKQAVDIKVPGKPCEMKITLKITSDDGQPVEPGEREIRVRYGWWAVIPALLIAGLLGWIFAKLLLNNEPRKWMVYGWTGAFDMGHWKNYRSRGAPRKRLVWNWLTKRGKLFFAKLNGSKDGGWQALAPKAKFIIYSENETPAVEAPEIVTNVSSKIPDRSKGRNFLYKDKTGKLKEDKSYIYLVIEKEESSGVASLILLILLILTIGTIGMGVFWWCHNYAI